MMAHLKGIALYLLERLFRRDAAKTAAVAVLERQVTATNQAPITHQEIADRLGKEGF